jgi:hypothetical protein
MKVSTLILLLILAGLGVLAYLFRGQILDQVHKVRYSPAESPAIAMERFRDAIVARDYEGAARYCTREYAELLVKCGPKARTLGKVIDNIDEFGTQKKLKTDETVLVLNTLDPFPPNFKVQGAVKAVGEKEAIGYYVIESFAWQNPTSPPKLNDTLDANMYMWSPAQGVVWSGVLRTPALFDTAGVRLSKDGDLGWKLNVVPAAEQLNAVRYFMDRVDAYTSELDNFRTYMTNDRYDQPKAFEWEVIKALGKAKTATRS